MRVIPTKTRTRLWLIGDAVLRCSTYTQDLGAHVFRTLMLFSKLDLCFIPSLLQQSNVTEETEYSPVA